MKKIKKYEKDHSSPENDKTDSDYDNSIVDVDFEFFNPRSTDVYTLRNLLKQLFGPDSNCFDIFELSDLIVNQKLVGTMVKVDGIEGDPLAFLTVLNLNDYQKKTCIKQILSYIMSKISLHNHFNETLNTLLKEKNENVGLILSERLINMPIQIVSPMYEMLFEEIEWALEDKEPYNFSHYIILSRSYQESLLKHKGFLKRRKISQDMNTLYFHLEDKLFKKNSLYSITYKYNKLDKNSTSKKVFQDAKTQIQGEIIMISKDKLKKAIIDFKSTFTE
ncbi:hypothetical protein PCANB_002658 [Pneumocystis canis]|nr:hypothetical protein PCK1_002673 [Pneumocystis canis]KAG5438554.1 hypothetical protein PCANB_002658 [Pneumocystis canis]